MGSPAMARLFTACGWVAAGFLVLILLLIVLQVSGRLFGFATPGITHYAGYCMAASSFFGLGYALHEYTHIRVTLFLNLSPRLRYGLELWCHLIGTGLAAYFCFYACKATWWSWKFHDISQGQDATPLWIPQLVMCCGTFVLLLALAERLYLLLAGRYPLNAVPASEA